MSRLNDNERPRPETAGPRARGVAHDLTDLLTVINGYSELLLDRLDRDDPNRRLVDAVHFAGARAAALMVHLQRASRIRGEATMSAKSSVPRSRETVLLVEDEDNVRALLRTLLGNEGYRVLEAPGGREALALCQQATGAIELLITDLNMPGMGGQQLAEAVYGQFPNVRVLYLSGYTDDAITRQGALQGRVTFLQKPFVTATLLRTVRDVLDAN